MSDYTFKKTGSRKWQGVGFGTNPASHELHHKGKPTGITVSGSKSGDYSVRKDSKHVTLSSTFANAKHAAMDHHRSLKEDLGGGDGSPTTGGIANVAGANVSTDPVHWSKRQPNIGPKGPKKKYGQPMVFKAIMRRKSVNEQLQNPPMKKVYYKILKKKVPAVSRTSASGGGSDGSSEQVQREHIVKTDGGFRLVSKKTGKNLGTYPSRAGAERRERQVQFFKHKG